MNPQTNVRIAGRTPYEAALLLLIAFRKEAKTSTTRLAYRLTQAQKDGPEQRAWCLETRDSGGTVKRDPIYVYRSNNYYVVGSPLPTSAVMVDFDDDAEAELLRYQSTALELPDGSRRKRPRVYGGMAAYDSDEEAAPPRKKPVTVFYEIEAESDSAEGVIIHE